MSKKEGRDCRSVVADNVSQGRMAFIYSDETL